jgi:hypothetical protein
MAHGHESPKSHEHGKGGEWMGPKLAQFLKASGLTFAASVILAGAFCMPIIPAYAAGQALVGGGVSVWGMNATKAKKADHGKGGHH